MRPVTLIVGTRPEAIKLAPVYRALRNALLPVRVIALKQHDMALSHMDECGIVPDEVIGLERTGDTVCHLLSDALRALSGRVPDSVACLVQGDTTTALAGAWASWGAGVPVGHVEAGLRTRNPSRPFPEEMNRRQITRLATWHYAPTDLAVDNLRAEGIRVGVYKTGNTGIDELHRLTTNQPEGSHILMTLHRRESWDAWLPAVRRRLSPRVIWPAHPNPIVRRAAKESGATVVDPLSHAELVDLMERARVVVTDSGGIIEEATALGKRLLILREETERPEALATGIAEMVSAGEAKSLPAKINLAAQLPSGPRSSIFGDGQSAQRIAGHLAGLEQ